MAAPYSGLTFGIQCKSLISLALKSKCGRIGLSIAAVAKTVEPSLHAGPGPPGPSASISCGTHRHEPGRTCHPPQPAGNGRIPRQIELRFIRAMGMGEQRDVGNAVGIASPMDHGCPHRCCSITASASSPRISRCGQLRFPRMPGRQKVPDETGRGHMRLMAVLLEEHPAQGLRALPRIIRQAGRTSGQPEQDCPGLGRHLPVLAYRQGHLAGGVQRQESRLCGSALASCPSRSRHKAGRVGSAAGTPCSNCPTATCHAPSASLQSPRLSDGAR